MRHLTSRRDWRGWIPAECPGCERRILGQGLCKACSGELAMDPACVRCTVCMHPLVMGVCPDCPADTPAYERIIAAFDYRGLGRDLIQDYKVRCRLSLAGVLADQLAIAVRQSGQANRPDWIVPVPARRQALRQRGFSPPAEVARLLAAQLGLACRLTMVRRVRDGRKQAALGRTDRLQAQVGLYVCSDAERLAGASVVVLDDVLTTGATMQAVSMALKAAGAARVEGWVLARVVRRPAVPMA